MNHSLKKRQCPVAGGGPETQNQSYSRMQHKTVRLEMEEELDGIGDDGVDSIEIRDKQEDGVVRKQKGL